MGVQRIRTGAKVPQKPKQSRHEQVHGQELNWSTLAPKMLEEKYARALPTGFVYVIREAGDGPYKIGYAGKPIARLRGLQTGNPRLLRVEHLVMGYADTERFLQAWARPHVLPGRVRTGTSGKHARDTEWFSAESYPETAELFEQAAQAQLLAADDTTREDMHYIATTCINHHPRPVKEGATIRLLAQGAGYVEFRVRETAA